MYTFAYKRTGCFKTLVLGVALTYLAVMSLVSLMHAEDCPDSQGADSGDSSFPSSAPCPACKFLAGSSSTDVQYDVGPLLPEPQVFWGLAPDSVVAIANPCVGSISLRAPPFSSLS